ncbi:MAG: hypothetical protein ABIP13_07090 [Tepidiformaceae bacterium]
MSWLLELLPCPTLPTPGGPMLHHARRLFATPARQAYGWAALGILGVAFAAVGVLLMSSNSGSPHPLPTTSPTATGTAATPAATATLNATATP